ncbi:MAG: hypothetical protein ACK51J_03060, partial [Burkholderiales bacterium]
MMFCKTGMLIALLALLTGCASKLVRAPEPVATPAVWSARIDTAAAVAAPVAAWWEELADDQLNRLVELALRDGADVSVAAAR